MTAGPIDASLACTPAPGALTPICSSLLLPDRPGICTLPPALSEELVPVASTKTLWLPVR